MAKTKGTYVDGFVLVVPKKKFGEYRRLAQIASKVWKRFGAVDYKECVIDDPKPKFVKLHFGKLMKQKKSEAVWFSFIVYKSRAHRDSVNKKVMAYFNKKYANQQPSMPFDMKRMSYGGFKVVVD